MLARSPIASLALAVLLGSCMSPTGIEQYLARADDHYSPGDHMVASQWDGPTYHTRVAHGTWVHSTVASLDYALALLYRDEDGDRDRVEGLLDKVISLQETRANNAYYGVWPWFLEEPIAAMNPPDRNWADFCGARLAHVLVDHGNKLHKAVRNRVKRSLGHAARAIRERDVSPDYTNIAVMGAGVALVAGEQLDEPEFLRYGREKLEQVVAHAARTANFQEYNSPNYTMVVVWECERTLHLVHDRASREAAESIRRTAWRTIAQSYHPATAQWAGPQSRAYSDRLSKGLAHEIADRVHMDIAVHPSQRQSKLYPFWTTPELPCPKPWIDHFAEPLRSPREIHRIFRLADDADEALTGTTWMATDVCLGTVNHASLWVQRRPLIAYWRTDEDPAIVLRLHALKNGRDFAAIGVRNQQRGPHVESSFYVLTDRGDWHHHLDKPKDSTYRAHDLRLRYELRGRGVTATQLGVDRFELRAGAQRAILHTTPGEFFGKKITFRVGEHDGAAFLDAILYDGPEASFDFRAAGIVGLSIELEIENDDKAYEIGTVIQPDVAPTPAPAPGPAK